MLQEQCSNDVYSHLPMIRVLSSRIHFVGTEAAGQPLSTSLCAVLRYLLQASLCLLQVKYPENFFLLRGNHECASINRIYGFYDECKRRYNIRLWKTFTDCFNCLPVAALVDEKVRQEPEPASVWSSCPDREGMRKCANAHKPGNAVCSLCLTASCSLGVFNCHAVLPYCKVVLLACSKLRQRASAHMAAR